MNKEWKSELIWAMTFLVVSVVLVIVVSFLVFENSPKLIFDNGLPFSISTCWTTLVIGRYFLIAVNRLISKSYVISFILCFFVLLIILKYIPDSLKFPVGYFSIPLPNNAGPFYGHFMLFDYYYRPRMYTGLLLITEIWLIVKGMQVFKNRKSGTLPAKEEAAV